MGWSKRERWYCTTGLARWMAACTTALHARASSNTSLAMRPKVPQGKSISWKMILGRTLEMSARSFNLHSERAGEAHRRGLNSKMKLVQDWHCCCTRQVCKKARKVKRRRRRNIFINPDRRERERETEKHSHIRWWSTTTTEKREDGTTRKTIPYRFRGAVRAIIFSLLSMVKLVKNSRIWTSKYTAHFNSFNQLWQSNRFALFFFLPTWNEIRPHINYQTSREGNSHMVLTRSKSKRNSRGPRKSNNITVVQNPIWDNSLTDDDLSTGLNINN